MNPKRDHFSFDTSEYLTTMPKAPTASSDTRKSRRHDPLAEEYSPLQPLKQKPSKRRRTWRADETENENEYVESKASQRILKIGQDLIHEDQVERKKHEPDPAFQVESRFPQGYGDDDAKNDATAFNDENDSWGEEEEDVVEEQVSLSLPLSLIHSQENTH